MGQFSLASRTINEPTPGKWILTGPKQEIERAIILTDVNLVSNFISGSYFQGEVISLNCHFAQLGEILNSPVVTDNTTVKAQFESNIQNYSFIIPYEKEGFFRKKITIDQPTGFYRIILAAQNNFLSRELQFVIDVYESPIKVSNSDSEYKVKLVRTDLIKEESAGLDLKFDNSTLTLEGAKVDGEWTLNLFPLCSNPSAIKNAHVYFHAKTISDRLMKLHLTLPTTFCTDQIQLVSELPKIEFVEPSLLQKIPTLPKEVKKKSGLLFTILFYSIIVLLLLITLSIVWVFMSGLKHGKKITQLKEQLLAEKIDE